MISFGQKKAAARMRVLFSLVMVSVLAWANAQTCTDIDIREGCCEVEACAWVNCADKERCISKEDWELVSGCKGSPNQCQTSFLIDVLDYPPSITPISDQTLFLPINSLTLHGNATDDHGVVSYEWSKVSGHGLASVMIGVDSPTLRVEGLQEGLYSFRLVVTDTGGLTSSTEIIVFVQPEPQNPLPLGPGLPILPAEMFGSEEEDSSSSSSSDSTGDEPLVRCTRPMCKMYCMYGFNKGEDGCPTCSCRQPCDEVTCPLGEGCHVPRCDDLECFSVKAECLEVEIEPPMACAMPMCGNDCPNGYRYTELGCMTCECANVPPPPIVDCPEAMCDMYCMYGFKNGVDGCPTCTCRDPCEELVDCPTDILGYRCALPTCDGLECLTAQPECRIECPMVKCVPCPSGRYAVNSVGCRTCECLPALPMPCPMPMCGGPCPNGYKYSKHGCMTCQCLGAPSVSAQQMFAKHQTSMIAAGVGLFCLIVLLVVVACMLHKRRSRIYQFKHKKLENMESFRKNLILGSDWQNPELKVKDDMSAKLIEYEKKPVV